MDQVAKLRGHAEDASSGGLVEGFGELGDGARAFGADECGAGAFEVGDLGEGLGLAIDGGADLFAAGVGQGEAVLLNGFEEAGVGGEEPREERFELCAESVGVKLYDAKNCVIELSSCWSPTFAVSSPFTYSVP